MNIEEILEAEKLTLLITGKIDTTTAPELDNLLSERYESINELVLDFAEVKYISSAGLRVLLNAVKMMSTKGGLKLKNVGPSTMEVFEMTGFAAILNIE